MPESSTKAVAQKNPDGTYSVIIPHSHGVNSEVHFPNVVFAETLSSAYANFVNGLHKVGEFVDAERPKVEAGAAAVESKIESLLKSAEAEVKQLKDSAVAEADKIEAELKAKVAALEAEAHKEAEAIKAEAKKILAEAQAEVAKLKSAAKDVSNAAKVIGHEIKEVVDKAVAPKPAAKPAPTPAPEAPAPETK